MEAFVAFASHQFELAEPQEDGTTLADHLEAFKAKNGRDHPMLSDAPRLPDSCSLLWSQFLELHSCRGSTMAGVARISFTDLDAFQRVSSVKFDAWEIDAIRRADSAYLAQVSKRVKSK